MSLIKRFEFSSELQRMSVIAKDHQKNELSCFVKGSPEMIESLCDFESIPENFNQILEKYTTEGYRVIAFAYKELQSMDKQDIMKIKRGEIEQDLTFLGIMIMENKTKKETKP